MDTLGSLGDWNDLERFDWPTFALPVVLSGFTLVTLLIVAAVALTIFLLRKRR